MDKALVDATMSVLANVLPLNLPQPRPRHPDRNKSPRAAEEFKELTEAYDALSGPGKDQCAPQ